MRGGTTVSFFFRGEDLYRAADHRNLTILSYLGRLQPSGSTALQPLNAMQPYRVSWDTVAVHVAHCTVPNSQVLYALNASVVALCTVSKDMVRLGNEPLGLILNNRCGCDLRFDVCELVALLMI